MKTTPILTAPCGQMQGVETNGISIYRNIPFALAPRWQAPVASEPWQGVRECLEYGPAPIQNGPDPYWAKRTGEPTEFPQSEECLNLNVWVGNSTTPKKAVLFWVYGGSYILGYNYKKSYLPDDFVAKHPEIIVVAPNYRVGVLGSLNLSSLTDSRDYAFSNNLALLDILCALHWTQKNITAFGGDPDKVTLYGHSAGSNAISHLMAMPQAKGLFKRTICQSSYMTDLGTVALDTSEAIGKKFFELAGCTTLDEALALPCEKILQVQKELFKYQYGGSHASKMFSPVEDGLVVAKEPFSAFVRGEFNGEQVMIGGSQGEYDQMIRPKTLEESKEFVVARNADKKLTPEKVEEFIALHPEMDAKEAVMSIHNELGLSLGGEWIGRAICKKVPVYEYNFWLREGEEHFRAAHGAPSNYVFNTLPAPDAPAGLVEQMMDSWAAFIQTGDPNNARIPAWPRYEPDGTVMVMDREWKTVNGYWAKDFAFWRSSFAENKYNID